MSLRENIASLEDDELLQKVRSLSLTDEADSIAREILVSRGIQPPEKQVCNFVEDASPKREPWGAFLKSCLNGSAPLSSAYWGMGFLLIVLSIVMIAGMSFFSGSWIGDLFDFALFTLLVVGSPAHVFCVWQCSDNTNLLLWNGLAKGFVMIMCLVYVGLIIGAVSSW
jgi:hypothetical protein